MNQFQKEPQVEVEIPLADLGIPVIEIMQEQPITPAVRQPIEVSTPYPLSEGQQDVTRYLRTQSAIFSDGWRREAEKRSLPGASVRTDVLGYRREMAALYEGAALQLEYGNANIADTLLQARLTKSTVNEDDTARAWVLQQRGNEQAGNGIISGLPLACPDRLDLRDALHTHATEDVAHLAELLAELQPLKPDDGYGRITRETHNVAVRGPVHVTYDSPQRINPDQFVSAQTVLTFAPSESPEPKVMVDHDTLSTALYRRPLFVKLD